MLKSISRTFLLYCLILCAAVCNPWTVKAEITESGNCGLKVIYGDGWTMPEKSDNVKYEWDDSGVVTFTGSGEMWNYGNNVITNPFCRRDKVKKVIIREGVTSIGSSTFAECSKLEKVTIPNTLKTIGDNTFELCYALKSVSLPQGMTGIGREAFSWSGLQTVTLPDSIKEIGEFAFVHTHLVNVRIPKGITKLETCVLAGCQDLTGVSIPDSVTVIGEEAFNSCGSLKKVVIPDSVTVINKMAFTRTGLTGVTIPGSVVSVDEGAFKNCEDLTKAVIKEGVKNLGTRAFYGCGKLETVELPSTIAYIDPECFNESGLKDVYYNGTKEQWDKIFIFTGNDTLLNASIHVKSSPDSKKSSDDTKDKTAAKKANTLIVKAKTVKVDYAKLKKKNAVIKTKKAFSVKKAEGKVTFKKTAGSKKIAVSKAGKITVKKKLKKGQYIVSVKVKAAGNGIYKAKSKTVKIKIIVK